MKKILIGLGVIIILAIAGRIGWAFYQIKSEETRTANVPTLDVNQQEQKANPIPESVLPENAVVATSSAPNILLATTTKPVVKVAVSKPKIVDYIPTSKDMWDIRINLEPDVLDNTPSISKYLLTSQLKDSKGRITGSPFSDGIPGSRFDVHPGGNQQITFDGGDTYEFQTQAEVAGTINVRVYLFVSGDELQVANFYMLHKPKGSIITLKFKSVDDWRQLSNKDNDEQVRVAFAKFDFTNYFITEPDLVAFATKYNKKVDALKNNDAKIIAIRARAEVYRNLHGGYGIQATSTSVAICENGEGIFSDPVIKNLMTSVIDYSGLTSHIACAASGNFYVIVVPPWCTQSGKTVIQYVSGISTPDGCLKGVQ